VSRMLRRLLYRGRYAQPVALRPLPSWPPAVDPWLHTSTTQILPQYQTYARTER
jgi:hypothetical protein